MVWIYLGQKMFVSGPGPESRIRWPLTGDKVRRPALLATWKHRFPRLNRLEAAEGPCKFWERTVWRWRGAGRLSNFCWSVRGFWCQHVKAFLSRYSNVCLVMSYFEKLTSPYLFLGNFPFFCLYLAYSRLRDYLHYAYSVPGTTSSKFKI